METGLQPMVYHYYIILLVLHRPDIYTICIWIFSFLMRATGFSSTYRPSVMYLESRWSEPTITGCSSQELSVSSHYIQQAANIDLEWNDWPRQGAQIGPNVVDVLLISCWASSDSLREKEGFRLCGSSNWKFLWFWTRASRVFDTSASLTMLPLGPEGPSIPVTPLTQGEHKIKHKSKKSELFSLPRSWYGKTVNLHNV